jgi:hypothetical protein
MRKFKSALPVTFSLFAAVSLSVLAQGCGAKSAKKAIAAISSENQFEFGSQSTSEAISAASAGDNEGSAGFSLASDLASPVTSVTRSCQEQEDGSAVVTISSEINVDKSSSSAVVQRSNKLSGKSEETRTWSHPSGVKCAADGQRAKVSLKSDAASYSLKVQMERSRTQTMSQTNLRKNTTVSSSRSFTMQGERTISVVSYSEDSQNDYSLQEKKVSGNMSRSFSFVDKSGATQTGSISGSTVGDPMVVKVKRALSSKELISREIVSGTRRSTLADGTMIDTSFSNFLMTGAGESCEAQSGSLSLKYLDSEGTATKTISCSASEGALSCTDEAGAEVEIENPSCDPADDK